jgi:hypothetical protein
VVIKVRWQYVQKYRDFAKKHPILQGFLYSALIAAAGISSAGLGGAAALALLKTADKALQGEDIQYSTRTLVLRLVHWLMVQVNLVILSENGDQAQQVTSQITS